ncbi:MAG: phosphopantetheine-binding protein [Acidobacteriota bacterium]|jgi:acyl carrier protein|nr:phosphopantetheine-binding protein [Acidobacteriota bacterium]
MEREMRIRNVISQVARMPIDVQEDDSLFDSGLLDSFMLVDLIAGIEEEFQIKIPDSDLIPQKFDSILKIDQYLAGHM